ncbi:MAG: TSUP family transporter [Planctomycetaceae bacterium]
MFEWTLISLLLALSVGGAVGFLSGLFGVGGGFLLVPFLNAVLGIPMAVAVGSTACYTIGPATAALLARKPTAGFFELPLILSGGLLVGVWWGATTLNDLQLTETISVFGRQLPAADLMVLLCYLVLMTVIATMSFIDAWCFEASAGVRRRGYLTRIHLPPMATIPDLRPARYSIPLLSGTAVVIGFLSGFLGMSGGLVLVPAAIYLLGLRVHDATTITIVTVWIVSVQSTVMHAGHGHVQLPLVAALLFSGTTGARLGAQIGVRMSASRLKLGFGLLVLVSAAIVSAKLWTLWQTANGLEAA